LNPKLFVPFDIRNKIINESNKDIDEYDTKNHYNILSSYMKESKIYNSFMSRYVAGIHNKTNNFGVSYDNFKKGISDTIKDFKYTIEHPYASLNCGFIMNPSRFGGLTANITETDLKAYWKYNEASGAVLNSSTSDETLGSDADMTITGATHQSGSPPVGNSMDFDGVNDYGVCSTGSSTKSQFNFLHNTSAVWTMAFWLKKTSSSGTTYLFSNTNTEGTDVGMFIRQDSSATTPTFYIVRGVDSSRVLNSTPTSGYFPDYTNWYFYVATYDYSLGSSNFNIRRNDANLETFSKTGSAASNADATYDYHISRNPNASSGFGDHFISEHSLWNKVMSGSDQTSLYNSGSGLEIYS
jgi:hypothetical protein